MESGSANQNLDITGLFCMHVSKLIFYILGYQGEEREKKSILSLDESWIYKYKIRFFFRIFLVYCVYSWFLFVVGRAVILEGDSGVAILPYSTRLVQGLLIAIFYVALNAIVDLTSLFFTTKHLGAIKNSNSGFMRLWFLLRELVVATALFVFLQVASNILWIPSYDLAMPTLERAFSLGIALWPYTFVFDVSKSNLDLVPVLFSGQILITGTAFVPTIAIALVGFITLLASTFLQGIKFCYFKLRQPLVAIRNPIFKRRLPGAEVRFTCINLGMIGVAQTVVGGIILEILKSLWSTKW